MNIFKNILRKKEVPKLVAKSPKTPYAVIPGTQTVTTSVINGKDITNTYHFVYMCYINSVGERTYSYEGYYGTQEHIFSETQTYIYVNYVYPWLNGAETIPERYLCEQTILCEKCSNPLRIRIDDHQTDYIKCNTCEQLNINTRYYSDDIISRKINWLFEKNLMNMTSNLLNSEECNEFTLDDKEKIKKFIDILHNSVK